MYFGLPVQAFTPSLGVSIGLLAEPPSGVSHVSLSNLLVY